MKGIALNLVGNDVWGNAAHSFNAITFNALNQQYSVVLRATEDATITHVGFNFNTRTGTPGDFTFRLGNVDGSGNPGTTIHASVVVASSAITYGGATGHFYWAALSSSYNVTRGEIVACTVIATAGTWDATNLVTLNYQLSSNLEAHGNRGQFPYATRGSSRIDGMVGGMRSSTTAYGYPIKHITGDTYVGTTTRYGTRFTVPSNMGASVRLAGIRFRAQLNTGLSYDIKVGTISGTTVTEIFTLNVDADVLFNAGTGGLHDHVLPTAQTLTAGQEYVIGILASGNNFSFTNIKLTDVIDRTAFTHSLYGTVKSGSWTSGGVWTDDNTRLYLIYPYVDLINAASGGSAVYNHVGMTGGIRG